ncbi:MAG: hypothetical protein RJA57_2036 [Bacteroidota bacterium]|jgi:NADH:ubiquinone oxidoreductase subunit C
MTAEAWKTTLGALLPSATFEEAGEFVTLHLEPPDWLAAAGQLRQEPALQLDYLFCLTCIDWKTHLTLVYHLASTEDRTRQVVVKLKLDRSQPAVESVSGIWRTAEFHEREVYEMFGVQFLHHPDLRLLILPDGWEGKHPMRKDFEDPVNMIRL